MPEKIKFDLSHYELYLNRELTWLAFNDRVLHEAEDERNPLLERVKFIAIVASNLDEFFMKRIGGLKQQVWAGVQTLTVDGRTPQQQIEECSLKVKALESKMDRLWKHLKTLLADEDIHILTYDVLTDEEKEGLREHYLDNIYPLVTPQAIDIAHPFPFISNHSLNLLVSLHYREDRETKFARVKVPVGTGISRFQQVGDSHRYVLLEEVMEHNFDLLFPNMEIDTHALFYVVRNAIAERDEEAANDLLAYIEEELRERRFAPIVRMTIETGLNNDQKGILSGELGLDIDRDVYERSDMLAMTHLWQIASLPIPELRDRPYHPVDHPQLHNSGNIFYTIRNEGAVLLRHPYNSFNTSVEAFLQTASVDPKVRAVKMTLYRTSSDTKVIDYLVQAARNGKQVAVVVELKARFDEAANIEWASRMEEAGVHVTYGILGLKTHTKIILVIRQDYNGLRRYAHIGTGNYHAGTARLYSDLGLLTNDDVIGRDLTELFNYLTTGYTPKRNYQKILPAPKILKRSLLNRIKREIENKNKGEEALIQFKCNALEDKDVVKALYEASQAGVKVDLIIRDSCRLRPGIEGLSDNIRVISIVGRFLEHARIYYFHNQGEDEYFIGSADAMKRNLESRVEILAPIERAEHKAQLREVLDIELTNQRSVWEMQSDGNYQQRVPESSAQELSTHEIHVKLAEAAYRGAARLKKRKPKLLSK